MSQSQSQSQSQPPPATVAGKSTKQSDGDSMSSILLKPLNDLQTLSHMLFLSLSPPQNRPPPAPPLSAFLECDKALAEAVNLAHVHQVKQRKIESLEAELLDLEAQWREICQELATGKQKLEEIIEEGDERIKNIHAAKQAAIPYTELLAYAQSLSAFTSAPPNMPDLSLPGQPPPPLFFPPFPNEEKMRRGKLNEEEDLGPLGETHSVVGKAASVSPPPEANNHAPGANPYRHEFRETQDIFDLDLDLNPDLDL